MRGVVVGAAGGSWGRAAMYFEFKKRAHSRACLARPLQGLPLHFLSTHQRTTRRLSVMHEQLEFVPT